MDEADQRALAELIRGQRTASLGTLLRGAPYVSLVLYAEDARLQAFYLHLSRLAVHTQNLQAEARASLMIAQPDRGTGDPQALPRVSLQATAEALAKDSSECAAAQARYIEKFPESAPIFDLADFDLYRLTPHEGRFIAAFGRILRVSAEHLRQAGTA